MTKQKKTQLKFWSDDMSDYSLINRDRQSERIKNYIYSFDSTGTPYLGIYPPGKFSLLYGTDTGQNLNFNSCIRKSFSYFLKVDVNPMKKPIPLSLGSTDRDAIVNDLDKLESHHFTDHVPGGNGISEFLLNVPTRYAAFTVVYQIKTNVLPKWTSWTPTLLKYYIIDRATGSVAGFDYLLVEHKFDLPLYPKVSDNDNVEDIPVKIFHSAFKKLFNGFL